MGSRPLSDQPCTLSMPVLDPGYSTVGAGLCNRNMTVGQNVSDAVDGRRVGRRGRWAMGVQARRRRRERQAPKPALGAPFRARLREKCSYNYQVQRRATAHLARGRDSDRVRVDADRPRHALYVSPVRCNAELGGTIAKADLCLRLTESRRESLYYLPKWLPTVTTDQNGCARRCGVVASVGSMPGEHRTSVLYS
jgi:hypothetical protein